MVIDADGRLITDYNKVHLVTGLESQFRPGSQPGLFVLMKQHLVLRFTGP